MNSGIQFFGTFIFLFIYHFLPAQNTELPFNQPPEWAKEAVWYQIFIERFRNGNPDNDPTPETCYNALSVSFPQDWKITPWGANWYAQEDWAKHTGLDFYRTIQMRRYGGDLQGVMDKIPYFQELGINAIYFNPLNDAPSLHKYDARNYHHIDVTLGADPVRDMELIKSENPADPSTWTWTSADLYFIDLIRKLHDSGIKVVLDFSWNHTGKNFWAFQDIEKNLDHSPYKDWYDVHFEKDLKSGNTKFTYHGWIGVSSLPELKKVNVKEKISGYPFEGDLQADVKRHIFEVCKRWMDPNGDGNFDDGIDGMRLDVAEHVPMGFWRDFRKFVRSVNPEFYLVGENWWTKWPEVLMDPEPWVSGDVFDAVMHYQWYKIARDFFAFDPKSGDVQRFQSQIDSLYKKYKPYTAQAMMNVSASHDAPRLLTCFANPQNYKNRAVPRDNPEYITAVPEQKVKERVKLFLLHEFTFVGAPHIWNGDEMGMTGADDPDCRKPLAWEDVEFENETSSSFSEIVYEDKVGFDRETFEYYKSLIALRHSSQAFSRGDLQFLKHWNDQGILAYTRIFQNKKYLIVLNHTGEEKLLSFPKEIKPVSVVFHLKTKEADFDINKGKLGPMEGVVLSLN